MISICATAVSAQSTEQQVQRVRQIYADTNKRIEAGLKDGESGFHYAAWTIGGERDAQQWRAVGTMKAVQEFWFDGEPGAEEDGEITDARRALRKIVASHTAAGRLTSRAEYYFDDASGELVFAFTGELDPDDKMIERRFYYNKSKLIRVASAGKNIDRNVGEEDKQLAANAQSDAKRLQNLFALMFAEE